MVSNGKGKAGLQRVGAALFARDDPGRPTAACARRCTGALRAGHDLGSCALWRWSMPCCLLRSFPAARCKVRPSCLRSGWEHCPIFLPRGGSSLAPEHGSICVRCVSQRRCCSRDSASSASLARCSDRFRRCKALSASELISPGALAGPLTIRRYAGFPRPRRPARISRSAGRCTGGRSPLRARRRFARGRFASARRSA